MSGKVPAVRGMNDLLPEQAALWQLVERTAAAVFARYGYREMRIPVVERSELFSRSIGEVTDVVEKEMYSFEDRGGERLSLRPEATAGLVRAALDGGMLHSSGHRIWTSGPMFRYERPQKGRYRQFHQLDVEAYGFPGPDVDAELILLAARLWRELGISGRLLINTLGTPSCRAAYRDLLRGYLGEHRAAFDQEVLERLERNPLRILDSKDPALAELIAGAPAITDHLDAESAAHFDGLRALLDAAGQEYEVQPRLVRGLDYYTHTVFEWIGEGLGAQDAFCSGGRYDGLVEQLGGKPTPGVGWALGMERLVSMVEAAGGSGASSEADVYLVVAEPALMPEAMGLAEAIRDAQPGLRVITHAGGGSYKSQFKRADRSGAALALVLGPEEVQRGEVGLKPLRGEGSQESVAREALPARIAEILEG